MTWTQFGRSATCWLFFITGLCVAQDVEATSDVGRKSDYMTTVGMPGKLLDLILPGPELEVKPIERDSIVVVRILQTIKHGSGHRYDLEYFCLEPGEYNLADYLRPKAESTASEQVARAEFPEIKVTVKAQLGEGQVLPNALRAKGTPRVGGYTLWLIVGGLIWISGLFVILFGGRKKEQLAKASGNQASLADRLRPLVEQARAGNLTGPQQAELERMLLTYWRGKLSLNDAEASQAISELRNHETAGQLLRQLENWLHMPPERRTDVNVAELLAPYQNVRDVDYQHAPQGGPA